MIDFEKELKENIFEIIESISDEVLISDGGGTVLWVNRDSRPITASPSGTHLAGT